MKFDIRRAGWPVSLVLALLCALMLVFAPSSDILTTIEIAAPPASVWSVLTDPDRYPAWNPMIAGPRVLVAERDRELRWRGHLWGVSGLFIGELLWLFDPQELVPAFEAMNVALAARAKP